MPKGMIAGMIGSVIIGITAANAFVFIGTAFIVGAILTAIHNLKK